MKQIKAYMTDVNCIYYQYESFAKELERICKILYGRDFANKQLPVRKLSEIIVEIYDSYPLFEIKGCENTIPSQYSLLVYLSSKYVEVAFNPGNELKIECSSQWLLCMNEIQKNGVKYAKKIANLIGYDFDENVVFKNKEMFI